MTEQTKQPHSPNIIGMENIAFLGSSEFSERQGGNRPLHAKAMSAGVWAVPFVLSQAAADLVRRTNGRVVVNVIVDVNRPTFAAPPVMSAAMHAVAVVSTEEYEAIKDSTNAHDGKPETP
jgi:hypothetical protein